MGIQVLLSPKPMSQINMKTLEFEELEQKLLLHCRYFVEAIQLAKGKSTFVLVTFPQLKHNKNDVYDMIQYAYHMNVPLMFAGRKDTLAQEADPIMQVQKGN